MTVTNKASLLNALLRQRFDVFTERVFRELHPGIAYQPNWHVEAIEHQLTRCMNGEITRLIITMPPRSLKSICASVAFPAWLLGRNPSVQIICASYAQDLASELSRGSRQVMEAPWYRRAFPATRLVRSTSDRLATTLGGGRLATSVGGALTGMGGDFIIVDDPLKALDAQSEAGRARVIDWFNTTLRSRLNSKQSGVIIVVMQRVHMDDLAGHLLKQGGWEHLDLPAIAELPQTIALPDGRQHIRWPGEALHPEREPVWLLERLREEMGTYLFSAQYQQRPVPAEGNLIRWEWFVQLEIMPEPSIGDGIYQSWDMAMKDGDTNNYSVCTTWLVSQGNYYLLDVYRARADFPTLRQKVTELALKWKANKVIIEDAAAGIPILQELKRDNPHNIKFTGFRPQGDKTARLAAVTPIMEQGRIFLPANAPWLRALMEESLAFPHGTYDDQVDSLSQFLNWHLNKPEIKVVRLSGL